MIKKSVDSDFCPIKDIIKKNKRGCTIGNLTLLASKKDYKKFRNILVKELNIKGCLFRKKKEKKVKSPS